MQHGGIESSSTSYHAANVAKNREDIDDADEDNNVNEWRAAARRGEKAREGHRTAAVVVLRDILNTVHLVVERRRRRRSTGMAVAVAADVALGFHHYHHHHVGPHDHSPIIHH